MTPTDAVGVVGVGTMGRIVTARLVAGRRTVLCFDPSAEAQEAARTAGAAVAEARAEVAAAAGTVLLFLPGPAQVAETVAGSAGLLSRPRDGQVIVDLSTSDPETTRRMAALASGAGVGYLDAPVLGRPRSFGRWVLPVGGDLDVLDRCRPILESFAAEVVHIGPSGAGHTLKLLNQMMFAVINAATAEILAVAARAGIPAGTFVETIASSGAATVSGLFREVGEKIAGGDFEPIFSVDLLCKDVDLSVRVARSTGVPTLLLSAAQVISEIARRQGYGALDSAAVAKVYEGFLTSPAEVPSGP